MRPALLRRRRRSTSRPARLEYSSFDEASLFNPSHPASRRFNVGKRAGATDGVKTLLGFYIRPSRDLRKCRDIVADQLVEPFWRGRLRLQADRGPALFRVGLGEDAHDLAVELGDDGTRDGGRREQPEPQDSLVARYAGLRDGRHFGQKRVALRRRHAQAREL